ncbi:MAG: hypothetical protein Q7S03_03645 [bacterium]|nr:hypothetical protein [bacterium]
MDEDALNAQLKDEWPKAIVREMDEFGAKYHLEHKTDVARVVNSYGLGR